jgi:hypothetical protein
VRGSSASGMRLLVSSGHDPAIHVPHGTGYPAYLPWKQKNDRAGNVPGGPYIQIKRAIAGATYLTYQKLWQNLRWKYPLHYTVV